jgi:predicted Zn-dependent peptidase
MNIVKRDINGLNLFYLPSEKFKTIDVAFVFTNSLDISEVNERNLLTEILVETTKKYNSPEKMSLACDKLYGLDKTCNYHIFGNTAITTFLVRTINDKYLGEDNIVSLSLDLLLEIIYNPKLFNGSIPKKSTSEMISQTKELLLSLKQNKNAYAYYNFMKEYTRNNQDRIGIFPVVSHFSSLNNQTLTKTYNKMINEDKLQIFIAGDFDFQEMDALIKEKMENKTFNKDLDLDLKPIFRAEEKINEVIETTSNGQTRVFIGYNLDFVHTEKNALLMSVFDELFGGYEHSKLFQNIREKQQLSYYVYSRYLEDNHLFFVNLETSKELKEKAISEVETQLQDCQNGNISDEIFEQAKQNLIKRLEKALDSQTKMLLHNILNYLKYDEVFDFETKKADILAIKKAEVIDLIRRIKKDTIYVYTNEG